MTKQFDINVKNANLKTELEDKLSTVFLSNVSLQVLIDESISDRDAKDRNPPPWIKVDDIALTAATLCC